MDNFKTTSRTTSSKTSRTTSRNIKDNFREILKDLDLDLFDFCTKVQGLVQKTNKVLSRNFSMIQNTNI